MSSRAGSRACAGGSGFTRLHVVDPTGLARSQVRRRRPRSPTLSGRWICTRAEVAYGGAEPTNIAHLGHFNRRATPGRHGARARERLTLYCESSRTTFASVESSVQGYPTYSFPMLIRGLAPVLHINYLSPGLARRSHDAPAAALRLQRTRSAARGSDFFLMDLGRRSC